MNEKQRMATVFICLLVCFLLVLGVLSYTVAYPWYQRTQLESALPSRKGLTAEQVHVLVARVSELVLLPSDESPDVILVADAAAVRGTPFFAHAQDDDRVLIYSKNQRAILYRPSLHKVIEMTAVPLPGLEQMGVAQVGEEGAVQQVGAAQAAMNGVAGKEGVAHNSAEREGSVDREGAAGQVSTQMIRVTIANGTKTAGLAAQAQTRLQQSFRNLTVVALTNTTQKFEQNFVIDVKGQDSATAKQLADVIEGKVVLLPQGEKLPDDADFLVIAGKSE